jgi:hypothetical protein
MSSYVRQVKRAGPERSSSRWLTWMWFVAGLEAGFLFYMLYSRRQKEAVRQPEEPPPSAKAAPPGKDDLTRIEGIGPKISIWLAEAGVRTYRDLAAADVSRLREILAGKRLAFIDPATWPEQARLAAAGDWEGLQSLQAKLKGGRQVA